MIELINDVPDGVIGVRFSGTIDSAEFKRVVDPAIEAARSKGQKVSALIVFEPSAKYTAGAAWQDSKLHLAHPFSWHRLAMVAEDSHWTRLLPGMSAVMRGEIKQFKPVDMSAAIAWLTSS